MVNYFDAIKLYRWSMQDEIASKIEEKVQELDFNVLLFSYIGLIVVSAIISIFYSISVLSAITPFSNMYYIMSSLLSTIIGLVAFFGIYYFLNMFFKTELTAKEYYKMVIYLYLPFYIFAFIIYIVFAYVGTYIPVIFSLVLMIIIMIVIFYYGLKILSTYLGLFSISFNTTVWKLFWVLLLFGIIMAIISSSINGILLAPYLI